MGRTANQINLLNRSRGTLRLLTWFSTVAIVILSIGGSSAQAQDWPMFGQNIANSASTLDLGPLPFNVSRLQPKWTFTTGGDVSARAAVVQGVAYFPDWGGYLWAVNTQTGKAVWSHQLSDYGLPANTHSRTSPAVANGIVYVGTPGRRLAPCHQCPYWSVDLEDRARDGESLPHDYHFTGGVLRNGIRRRHLKRRRPGYYTRLSLLHL